MGGQGDDDDDDYEPTDEPTDEESDEEEIIEESEEYEEETTPVVESQPADNDEGDTATTKTLPSQAEAIPLTKEVSSV